MRAKFLKIALVGLFAALLVSCDSNQENHQQSLEEQLVESFETSDQATRDRVAAIVEASKKDDYAKAMNELGLLSAGQINNRAQDYAIKRLMDQLRFDMEEEELAQRPDPS